MSDSLLHVVLVAVPLLLMAPLVWILARTRRAQLRALRQASLARDRLNDALEGSQLAVFDWNMGANSVS